MDLLTCAICTLYPYMIELKRVYRIGRRDSDMRRCKMEDGVLILASINGDTDLDENVNRTL